MIHCWYLYEKFQKHINRKHKMTIPRTYSTWIFRWYRHCTAPRLFRWQAHDTTIRNRLCYQSRTKADIHSVCILHSHRRKAWAGDILASPYWRFIQKGCDNERPIPNSDLRRYRHRIYRSFGFSSRSELVGNAVNVVMTIVCKLWAPQSLPQFQIDFWHILH